MSQTLKKAKPKQTMADKILKELQDMNITLRANQWEMSRQARLLEVCAICLDFLVNTQNKDSVACDKYKEYLEHKLKNVLQTDYNWSWSRKENWNK